MSELMESLPRGARTWTCQDCGWIYAEAIGMAADGIPPGTPWDELPASWTCPECGAHKEAFVMVQP